METAERPAEPTLSEAARGGVGEMVRRFDPLDRAILEARLGLHGRRRQPLAEIAASLGVLPSRVRLVEGELGIRLRSADPAVVREYGEFLAAANRREAADDQARGIRPAVDRRRRPLDGEPIGFAGAGRRKRRAGLPNKAALAPILPGLTRTQVLVSDELYGLVSGAPAPPGMVAARLGVPAGEVRATDRLVRRLVAERADLLPSDDLVQDGPIDGPRAAEAAEAAEAEIVGVGELLLDQAGEPGHPTGA